jgi:hypothetical protein
MNNDKRIEQQAQTIFDVLDTVTGADTVVFTRDATTGRYVVRVSSFDNATSETSIETVSGINSRDALAQACQVLVK